MKQEKKYNLRKIIIMIAICLAVIVGGFYLSSVNMSTKIKKTVIATKTQSNSISVKDINSNNTSWPKPPLTCANNISLVPLTSYYVISGFNCNDSYSSKPVLSCDGNTFYYSVSLNCYKTTNYSYNDQLVCNGNMSAANNSLNYTCSLPDLANTPIYSCTGNVNIPNLSDVSVLMSVTCNSA